jgi:hypothetical protein
MIEWLLTSIDPDRVHQVDFFISWHGRLMAFAWGGLVPIGILVARYFKVLPNQNWPQELDNQTWWNTHRIMQYGAALFMSIGLGLILYKGTSLIDTEFHRRIGWVVVILTCIQIFSGIFRGTKGGPTDPSPDGSLAGDHYDMTQHRIIFEYFHKLNGYLLLSLASYCIVSGMWIANAPIWMWLGLLIWWTTIIGLVLVLEKKGACFDTYQAIWGPSKDLTGNQMKPIGFRVNNNIPWLK